MTEAVILVGTLVGWNMLIGRVLWRHLRQGGREGYMEPDGQVTVLKKKA